ncbi:Malignant fibrous histiocytoma-amplified sequence 1 [Phytophthora megakarya]|uniref:Malignant fibrous histiocytoma-amplified sequence 1 n=1 Tax=Phytophthora megakarya TaxID=4795 RepID=A0A225VYY4_9STRA|nr:Malignant fibrous histiocytoma-amplified sequence 1 [Phytophthora megakarya]
MERRQLVLACNTFGDGSIPDQKGISSIGNLQTESLSLRGLGLECIPNAVLLKTELKSLNISGNELTELPVGLRQLKNLRELDASENALIEFPACVRDLTRMKVLRLAHNNISTISPPVLPHLSVMDVRWNAVTHLPFSSLATLKSLVVLQTDENAIPDDELSKISDLLSSREVISPDAEAPNLHQAESKRGEDVTEEPTQTNNSEESIFSQSDATSAITTTTISNAADTEPPMPTEDVNMIDLANEADEDQIMEQVHVDTAPTSKEDVDEQLDTEVEIVDSAS